MRSRNVKRTKVIFCEKDGKTPTFNAPHDSSYSDVVGKVPKIFKKPKHKNLS